MPVLLEDSHEDAHAWSPVEDLPNEDATIAPPPAGFTTMLTTVVTLLIVLLIAGVAFAPTLLRKGRAWLSSYRVTGPKSKAKGGAGKKSGKAGGKGMRRAAESEEAAALKEEEEEEDGDEEEGGRGTEEEEEEEEEEESFEQRYVVGGEAKAVNLREKKYVQHNNKLGVIKKVDARQGKVYLEMKASGARLVLKGENVVPVSHGKERRAPKRAV